MKKAETERAKLVVFADGGDTLHYAKGHTCSGYGTPENPHAARPDNGIQDGCPVLDIRPALRTKDGFAWVFRGPLVDVDLPDGQVDPLDVDADNIVIRALQSDSGNAFGTLLTMHEAERLVRPDKPGPLDHVSINEYIDGWRQHGAIAGHYESGRIVWE